MVDAILDSQSETVEKLLDAGADPNYGSKKGILTPLMYATLESNAKLVGILLARGADPNYETLTLSSPLNIATYNKDEKVAILLLQNGTRAPLRQDQLKKIENAELTKENVEDFMRASNLRLIGKALVEMKIDRKLLVKSGFAKTRR